MIDEHADSIAATLPLWPEDWQATEETLDPVRIAAQGESLLYRALNTQHLIAFVGSGVSAAYGRVSWPELVLFHVQKLQELLAGTDEQGAKLQDGDCRSTLLQQLRDCTDSGRAIPGDQIMPALMLCEQIWRLTPTEGKHFDLQRLADCFSLSKRLARLKSAGGQDSRRADWGRDLFRTWVKRETHNEFPHVLRVLAGTDRNFGYFLEELCGERRSENTPAITGRYRKLTDLAKALTGSWQLDRSNVENCSRLYASLFSNCGENMGIKQWLRLLAAIRDEHLSSDPATGERARIDQFAIDVLSNLGKDAGAGPISPVRYFIFGLVLDLLRIRTAPAVAAQFLEDALDSSDNYSMDAFRQRDSLIPRSVDPLHEMAFGLGMRRFATTNYDLEIERFFHDIAFAPPPPLAGDAFSPTATSIRVGPIGGRTRDFVLSDETVADLIDFATGDNAYSFEVVHLHGRATYHDPIVVTERDYQDIYLRDSKLQSAVNEAREAALGGNPILFVGFGMTESDVLRPLREFVNGPVRRNRSIIALLPADRSKSENDSFAMDQYVKHGVSVVRYDLEDHLEHRSGWLHRIFTVIKDLTCALRTLGESQDDRARKQGLPEPLLAAVGELQRKFRCSGEVCEIGFEIQFLHDFACVCHATAQSGAGDITTALCGQIAPALLERVKVAIQTAALRSKLAAIRNGWEHWWRDWQLSPLDRADFLRYTVLRSPRSGDGPIWSRHRVNEGRMHEPAVAPPSWDPTCLPQDILDGRRCIVITSRTGAGKGNLYSYLTGTWENSRQLNLTYLGQFFTTFGYDCEIASVWDALPMFLLSPMDFPLLGDPQPRDARAEDEIWRRVESCGVKRSDFKLWSRRERLDRALRVAKCQLDLAAKARNVPAKSLRLLVAFNVFDTLFDAAGRERQSEIHDVFRILFSKDHADLQLDLFFVVRDTHLPQWFRRPRNGAPPSDISVGNLRLLLSSKQQDPQHLEAVRATLERSHAKLIDAQQDCTVTYALRDTAEHQPRGEESRYLLYVLPPSDPAQFNVDDFDKTVKLDRPIKEFLEATLQRSRRMGDATLGLRGFFKTHLGSNRYAYALLIMIARDILQNVAADRDSERTRLLDGILGAIELTPRSSEGGVSDRFFEIVLDYWFEPCARLSPRSADDNPVLHEYLIRHLAVISMPARPYVLATCPQIRKHLHPLGDNQATELVYQALEKLVLRGLVFRIDGVQVGVQETQQAANRYQIHRSIRMHVYRRLGSQHSERGPGHIFGPSLYAAQTRNFPRLNPAAYAFLCELVDKLSSYPEPFGEPPPPCASREERKVRADCLRAALGVMRTLCSLGVVTRFADSEGLPARSAAQMGYLEHHRLVIRWMIKLAAWLDASKPFVRPPFYRDETVWLYNECGVFSYAQGRCYDARALFERALALQTEIEGESGGPMRGRILLNAGLNAIDCGRLSIARRAFNEVEAARHGDPLSRLLAMGFLGFVDHLSGELSSARNLYDEAIKGLTAHRRIRPVALLKQHSGYLYMHLDKFEQARAEFCDALQLAEAGGYADIAHYARLAEAKANMRDADSTHKTDSALRRIQAAQDYADRMDIPRLTVDVLLFRGEILLQQGETTLAGQLITRGLEIANLNGLMFRRIYAMEWLSAVYEARDNRPAAAQLRACTLRAARTMGYHLSVFRTNRAVF